MILRHGDIDILPVANIPQGVKSWQKGKNIILVHGESGNSHKLIADYEVEVFEDDKGIKYFNLPKDVVISHEQHNEKPLRAGTYKILIETERDPYTEAINRVKD